MKASVNKTEDSKIEKMRKPKSFNFFFKIGKHLAKLTKIERWYKFLL